jgi:hypothetical protein
VGSQSPSSDVEASSKEITPLQRKKRLVRSYRSAVGGPPLSGQHAPKKVARPQPDPKAVASTALGGSGGGRSTTSIKEATADNKDAEAVAAKEAMTVRKAAEAAAVKKATKEAAAKEEGEAAAVKKTVEDVFAKEAAEAAARKKDTEEVAARADIEKASDSTPAPGSGTKRAATLTSGSNPPTKRYHDT